jgi:hypothetical protein
MEISFDMMVEQWKRKNLRFFLFHCSTIMSKEIYLQKNRVKEHILSHENFGMTHKTQRHNV